MEYRFLGNTGLSVSVFSYGNWLNSNTEDDIKSTRDIIKKCHDSGVNFFDTAEYYGFGQAETAMGRAFADLELKREEIVVTTKLMKSGDGVNDMMLSRKHVVEGTLNSLKRLQLDYVDVIYAHRYDY